MGQQSAEGLLPDYLLEGVDCPTCGNKGRIDYKKDGLFFSRECLCMKRRRTLLRMKQSGLLGLLGSYTFDKYQTPSKWQATAKSKAQAFLVDPLGHWFVISGNPGSGKTHLCTAICAELMNGGHEVLYMLWRDEVPHLKALVNEREQYEREMKKYKQADVLYVDDFFKGNVTDGDINLAFELLNARYNNPRSITLISSEKAVENLLNIDEAIGSRIVERSKGFCIKTPAENWRLKS